MKPSRLPRHRRNSLPVDAKPDNKVQQQRPPRRHTNVLDLNRAVPLVERALHALERRSVQPQLGLLKSTMLQFDARFSEKAYGASSFSEFVERLREAGYLKVSGTGGQATIESKTLQLRLRPLKP